MRAGWNLTSGSKSRSDVSAGSWSQESPRRVGGCLHSVALIFFQELDRSEDVISVWKDAQFVKQGQVS